MRRCSKCKRELHESAFSARRDRPSGLRYKCRECCSSAWQEFKPNRKRRAVSAVRELRTTVPHDAEQNPFSVAILADLHIPEHDAGALGAVEEWLLATQPEVVVLAGDVGEYESASQHSHSERTRAFMDDVRDVALWLSSLRGMVPEARLVMLEGNHESRRDRTLRTVLPRLGGLHSMRDDLGLEALGIEWFSENERLQIGTLDIIHGHQLGERPPTDLAKKLATTYCEPGRTVVSGHAHRRQHWERAGVPSNAVGVSIPCLRTLRPGWTHGAEYGWSHGFAVAHVCHGSRTAIETIEINDGRFSWGGRWFGARTSSVSRLSAAQS